MKFAAFLFDLDGTLLDTLPDLVALTNMVLEEHGMPLRTSDEVNSFVGSGARMLLDLYKQTSGTAGRYQVKNVRNALMLNIGGSATTNYVFVVGME